MSIKPMLSPILYLECCDDVMLFPGEWEWELYSCTQQYCRAERLTADSTDRRRMSSLGVKNFRAAWLRLKQTDLIPGKGQFR